MPAAAIAVPVAGWLTAAGVSAAAAAVIGAAVAGAVYGAIIGAATAALTGNNILKGALQGAAIGGISAGVLQGVGAVDFLATSATAATGGAEAGAEAATAAEIGSEAGAGTFGETGGALLTQTGPKAGGMVGAKSVSETAKSGSSLFGNLTEGEANLLGGAMEGIGSGAGKVGGAMIEADAAKDLAEKTRKYEIDRINANAPGVSPESTAVVTLPQRWNALADVNSFLNQYKQPLDQGQPTGLLERKAA